MAEQEKEILEEEQTAEPKESPDLEEAEATDETADCKVEGTDGGESADGTDDAGEAEGTGAAPEGEDPKTWAEKRAAKKQAKQDKKTDAYKEQIAQLEDKVKRQLAEFENFRNRTEKEKQAMFEIGAKSVIEKILPVIDNFERGFATVEPEDKEDAFVDGMQRVYKQLMTELEAIGVKPIEAVGKEFDPNLHNAVMQVASEEYETGIVAQELQKGYTYRETVVRHSMVSVVE
ncbi:MAG: nucleotide exchange factor GrpE [Acetatifactor sp.]